ncbi:hypothetical protein DVH24_035612 [Malus domestica]|uniref:Uncharacterized protein n=1 Tax=Malus domestica TaxID=3750 RepID=A0A498JSZ1_MALDO|nr:hypothetical protein DVH24_035612 [Malus domestica]
MWTMRMMSRIVCVSLKKILEQAQKNEAKSTVTSVDYFKSTETPAILYEYVLMDRLVFLAWKVDKPIVWKHVLEEMLHAVLLTPEGIKAKRACNSIDASPSTKRILYTY